MADHVETARPAPRSPPYGGDSNFGSRSLREQISADFETRPGAMFCRPRSPRYRSLEEMKDVYEATCIEYYASSEAAQLKDTLNDIRGEIDRIVTVGLGCPSYGQPSVIYQCAMLAFIQDIISGMDNRNVELFGCDPAFTDLDTAFLQQELGMQIIDYDYAAEQADTRSNWYYFHIAAEKANIVYPSHSEKSPVWNSVEEITDRTLLFMFNVAPTISLRITGPTNPAVIITNRPSFFHKWAHYVDVKNGYTREEVREHFGAEWDSNVEAWKKFKHKYQRKAFT